jgi:alkylation response protein AidB-like acyl-CoA dehydrogenase
MDLNLDEDQREIIAMVRAVVGRTSIADQYDAINDTAEGRRLLAEFGELGWIGMSLPERVGGAGASVVDAALVLEEIGRGGLASPLIWSIVGARILAAASDDQPASPALEQVIEGAHLVTLAAFAQGAADEWSGSSARGDADGEGWTVSGRFDLVPYAHEADSVLFLADLEGRGRSLVHAAMGDPGISATRQRVIGGEARGSLTLEGWRATPVDVLALSDADETFTDGLRLATVLESAFAVGAAEGALQLSVTWSKDREQFGRPIGSFQTVSNRCADMRLGVDAARLLMWEAAWAIDTAQPDVAIRVSTAKGYLTAASEVVVTNSHQVHGAMGYSTEYPLHVLTRALKAYQASLGTATRHHDVVAGILGF